MKAAVYEELFQQVPYNVAVIDRDYNIVQANDNFSNYFGDWKDKKCYTVYKNLNEPCKDCPASEVFKNGEAIVADAVGVDQQGRKTHYIGHILPVRTQPDGEIDLVMEMTQPVTEINFWQREYQVLFDRVPCYITVIDEDYRIVRANEKFRENFGDVLGEHCYKVYKRREVKCRNCPAKKTFTDGKVHNSTQEGIGKRGQKIHYSVSTSALTKGTGGVPHVIEISKDITAIKHLEEKIIEAERLGAVGQTVAGLAHSIKNILMGLEGGKYIVSLGLKKNDKNMINKGWDMLERNFDKTTSLVKDFLSFSKGRIPQLKLISPVTLVDDIVDLYKDIAQQSGIVLISSIRDSVKDAPFDPDGMQTCLTNLVSNAIDACLMSERPGSHVVIKLSEVRGNIIFGRNFINLSFCNTKILAF